MATTAQQVFEQTMGLIDARNASGSADTADTTSYKNRTLDILNALCGELFPYSDSYAPADLGKRSVCPILTDFTSAIGIDEALARTVLPYGLAAQLLLDESPAVAGFMQQRYEELIVRAKNIPGEFSPIEAVYGGIENGQFSQW